MYVAVHHLHEVAELRPLFCPDPARKTVAHYKDKREGGKLVVSCEEMMGKVKRCAEFVASKTERAALALEEAAQDLRNSTGGSKTAGGDKQTTGEDNVSEVEDAADAAFADSSSSSSSSSSDGDEDDDNDAHEAAKKAAASCQVLAAIAEAAAAQKRMRRKIENQTADYGPGYKQTKRRKMVLVCTCKTCGTVITCGGVK